MIFDIVTIFPDSFSAIQESIVGRALEKNLIRLNIWDLRKWTDDKHKTVDDKPFGGGAGMVMKIRPIYRALKDLGVYPNKNRKTKVLITSAAGKLWEQSTAEKYAKRISRVVLICGHYEGVDHRVVDYLVDDEISIGRYILSGGEIPAMVLIDSVTRLLPDVLGNDLSLDEETRFDEKSTNAEYPQYTRPAIFNTDEGELWKVPDVLTSGNHEKIWKWRNSKRRVRKF